MFTSRKLTGDGILLAVSMLFQLNENTNMFTANREHIDCISHPNIHTYTHYTLHIQGVPGGMCNTSGGCSLGQTIPI